MPGQEDMPGQGSICSCQDPGHQTLGGWIHGTAVSRAPGLFSSAAQSRPILVTPWTAAHQASQTSKDKGAKDGMWVFIIQLQDISQRAPKINAISEIFTSLSKRNSVYISDGVTWKYNCFFLVLRKRLNLGHIIVIPLPGTKYIVGWGECFGS